MNDLPMQGRVALVAGASKGIGAATAEAFAAAGAAVVVAARDIDALNAVAGRIEANGGKALAVRADVSDTESQRSLIEQTLATFGRSTRPSTTPRTARGRPRWRTSTQPSSTGASPRISAARSWA